VIVAHSIRHLAAAEKAPVLAAGVFEKTVGLWHLGTGQVLQVLDTSLDFGGRRLTVSDDGELCFTGSYRRSKVECFNVATGLIEWQRNGVGRVQDLYAATSLGRLFCSDENRRCLMFEMRSGEHVDSFKGVKRVFGGGQDAFLFEEKEGTMEIKVRDQTLTSIELTSFAVLGVGCAKDRVCVSESGGPVRCFLLDGPQLLWQYSPPTGSHVTNIRFNSAAGRFVAVLSQYSTATESFIIVLDPESGTTTPVCSIGSQAETAFVDNARALVCADGRMFDTMSGRIVDRIDFESVFRSRL
jgi:hypothetical protein